MHNKIEELKTDQLERFGKLKTLVLKHNGLHTIEENALYGLDNLEVLDLSYNKLTSVPCEEFQWIRSLKTLHMTENPVASLSGQCFLSLRHIEEIDLSSNSITSVEEIPFDKLESLKVLDLSGNSLETIPAGFCPETGQTVNLHWNPWLCDCSLRPLRECESLSTQIKCAMPYQIRGWKIGDLENADQWMACGLPRAVSSKVMYIEEGDAVNLACDPEVDPYGDVVWWLVEDETWQARGELTIYVKNDHAGTYVCAHAKDKTKWAFQEVRVIPPETSPTPPLIPQVSTEGKGSTKSNTTPLKTTPSKNGATTKGNTTPTKMSPPENGDSSKSSSTTPLKTSPSESGASSAPSAGNAQSSSSPSQSPGDMSGNEAGDNIPSRSTPALTDSAKASTASGAKTSPKDALASTTKGDASMVDTVEAGEDNNNNAVPLVPGLGSKTTQKTSTTSGGDGAIGGPLSGSDSQTATPQSGQDGDSGKSRHRGDSVYPGGSGYGQDQTTQTSSSVSGVGLVAGVLPDGSVVKIPINEQGSSSGGQETKASPSTRGDMSGLWVIIAVAAIVATYILIGLLCCIVYKCRKRRKGKAPIVMIEESPEKHGIEGGNESIELVEKNPNLAFTNNANDQSTDSSISTTDTVKLSNDVASPTKWTAPGFPLALPDQNEGQILDRHSKDPSDRTSGPPRSDERLTQETAILDDSTGSEDDDEIPENVVNPDKWINPHQLQAIPDQKPDNRDSVPDVNRSPNGSESFWKNPLTSLDRKKIPKEPFQSKDGNSKTPKSPEEIPDVYPPPDLSDLPLFRSPKGPNDTPSIPDESIWKRLSQIDSISPYNSLTSSPTSSVKNDPSTSSKEPPFKSTDSPPAKIQDRLSDHLQQKTKQKPADEPKKENLPLSNGDVEKPSSPQKTPSNAATNIDTPLATLKDKTTDLSPRRPQEPPVEPRKEGVTPGPKSSENPKPPPSTPQSPSAYSDKGDQDNLEQKPLKSPFKKTKDEPQSTKPKEKGATLKPSTSTPSDQKDPRRLSLPLSVADSLKKLSIFSPEDTRAPSEAPTKPPRKSKLSGYSGLSRSRDFVIPPFDN
ncbi:PREDICTED: mucin-5AC-like [Branchiostoma belcheri]|uniref:Mucin-5AC-like n=1 Tax=Branchiostoma belcheri TaxID=7741 RepID=A0A6P4Y9A4_BRABE|nr:PREDICTED: mucin-5AC-like [Branchiostoma belcheri]